MARTVASRKARGRNLQQYVISKLEIDLGISGQDAKSIPGGVSGEDIWLSEKARSLFAYSVECKNQERLNIWEAIAQAEKNAKQYTPLTVFKRNRSEVYCALKFDDLLKLVRELNTLRSK
jgi:two-component SAPR family response regulator